MGLIRKTLEKANANGIKVSMQQLEAHRRVGGDIVSVVDALIVAKTQGIALDCIQAMAIDLARPSTGKDLAEVIDACVPVREHTFETFAPNDPEPLVGFTRDGSNVKATCTLRYRLTPQHVFGHTIDRQHERIAVRIAVLMNKAATPADLESMRSQHEAILLSLASEAGVEAVSLNYRIA